MAICPTRVRPKQRLLDSYYESIAGSRYNLAMSRARLGCRSSRAWCKRPVTRRTAGALDAVEHFIASRKGEPHAPALEQDQLAPVY